MNKLGKIILLIAILAFASFAFSQKAVAENFRITQITVTDFNNNKGTLNWKSNQPAKGTVFYGADSDNLNSSMNYPAYDYDHATVLSGLNENTSYYYKIVAYNRSGERIETFIQSFKTGELVDTIAPEFLEADLLQVTANAALISFESNEKVKATVYYGKTEDNLDKKKSSSSYATYGTISLDKLTPYARYYVRVEIQDEDGNKAESRKLFEFRTGGDVQNGNNFSIYDIQPLNFDIQYISDTSATIKWKTSLVAKSYIQYGEKSKKYNKEKIYANNGEWSNTHQVTITGLKQNTTYYFKITAEKSLYNKTVSSAEYSITTMPTQQAVLGTKISANDSSAIDSDHDDLSDSYELSLGTDPKDPDTDNDGYRDGLEVKNGYDPKGLGKLVKLIYGQPRASLSYEQAKAIELKNALDKELGKFSVSRNDWFTMVNAYVYGNYPVESISQSVKWSGKTVHPSINWQLWKSAPDYKNYINK